MAASVELAGEELNRPCSKRIGVYNEDWVLDGAEAAGRAVVYSVCREESGRGSGSAFERVGNKRGMGKQDTNKRMTGVNEDFLRARVEEGEEKKRRCALQLLVKKMRGWDGRQRERCRGWGGRGLLNRTVEAVVWWWWWCWCWCWAGWALLLGGWVSGQLVGWPGGRPEARGGVHNHNGDVCGQAPTQRATERHRSRQMRCRVSSPPALSVAARPL